MGKSEITSVKLHFSWLIAISIKRIIYDRDAKALLVRRVHSELVRATCDGVKSDAGETILDPNFVPMGDPYFPMNVVVDLVRTILDIEPEGERDCAFIVF